MQNYAQFQYEKLIHFRKHIKILDKKKYPKYGEIELHHILPSSLGGTDDATNLVYLFPREHYIAHLLLQSIAKYKYGESSIEYKKMLYAFRMMNVISNQQQRNFRMNSKLYEKLKKKSYKFLYDESTRQKIRKSKLGEKNPNYGKFGKDNPNFGSHRTEDQKQHIRNAIKNYYKNNPAKRGKAHHSFGRIRIYNLKTLKIKNIKKMEVDSYLKTGNWIIGTPEISDDTRKKMSNAAKRKIITKEHRQKMIDGTRRNMSGEKGKIIKKKISDSMKKLIWIYKNSNEKAIRVLPEEFGNNNKYKPSEGWKRGRPTINANMKWLYNPNSGKRIRVDKNDIEKIQEHLNAGYVFGTGNHLSGPKHMI